MDTNYSPWNIFDLLNNIQVCVVAQRGKSLQTWFKTYIHEQNLKT